jgi:predicted ester cyclase
MSTPGNKREGEEMSTASHKEIVRRYFAEAVDKRNEDILDELWTPDCVVHRPEVPEPIIGLGEFKRAFRRILEPYREFTTTIDDVIAEEDRVACRLSHRAVHHGQWTSRIGRHEVAGRVVSVSAMALFRFRDGKIAEEWVSRDELGMLIEVGVLSPDRSAS